MNTVQINSADDLQSVRECYHIPQDIERHMRWHSFFAEAYASNWPRAQSTCLAVLERAKVVGCCSAYRYPYPLPLGKPWMRRTTRAVLWPANPVNFHSLPAVCTSSRPDKVLPVLLRSFDVVKSKWFAPAIRMVMLDQTRDASLLSQLKYHGYSLNEGIVINEMEVRWQRFSDYFERYLSKNSRSLLRRALKKAQEEEVRIEVLEEPVLHQEQINKLLANVADHNRSESLWSHDFLRAAATHLKPEDIHIMAAWRGDKLVGCTVNLCRGDELTLKSLGLDYSVSQDLNLYRLLILEGVRYGIQRGFKKINSGFSQCEIKAGLGFSQVQTSTAIKAWPARLSRLFAYRSAAMKGPLSQRRHQAEGGV